MVGSPHHAVRDDWLALAEEEILAPDQPILDAHHHLWDRPEGRYGVAELLADAEAGHDVRASLYVQCRTGYRRDGPEALRPVGEVETIRDWAEGHVHFPAGIVAFADLQFGDAVAPVLDALIEAGEGLVRGIRNTTAFHPDPRVRSNPVPPPDGLLRSDAFRTGAATVAAAGLCLDVWAYQTQLDEVFELARALPDLTVVVDHCGGPLGVGPHDRRDKENFAAWRRGLAALAALPNTRVKVGGFGLTVMGYDYHSGMLPPHSSRLAADWKAYVDTCIALFGPQRAMFESNFPVDKGQFSYVALWNAFKRLTSDFGEDERQAVFWRSAARCYRVDERIFSSSKGRRLS
jgi:L-fuconolactonase